MVAAAIVNEDEKKTEEPKNQEANSTSRKSATPLSCDFPIELRGRHAMPERE